jgi:hypothetical protein
MVGALVRQTNGTGILKIVTEYKCDSKGEWILFAGEHNDWHELEFFEILSMEE